MKLEVTIIQMMCCLVISQWQVVEGSDLSFELFLVHMEEFEARMLDKIQHMENKNEIMIQRAMLEQQTIFENKIQQLESNIEQIRIMSDRIESKNAIIEDEMNRLNENKLQSLKNQIESLEHVQTVELKAIKQTLDQNSYEVFDILNQTILENKSATIENMIANKIQQLESYIESKNAILENKIKLMILNQQSTTENKIVTLEKSSNVQTEELKTMKQTLNQSSYASSGVFIVNPTPWLKNSFEVYRDVAHNVGLGGNWTVIQRRFDGSVGFNRTWNSYRNGFGYLHGEHWLGLEKVKRLLDTGRHELLFILEDFEGVMAYAHYDNFKIGSETERYKIISIGGYKGNAGDSFRWTTNDSFGTYDKDVNDCAQKYGGGGWFNFYFNYVSLNGIYQNKGRHLIYKQGINWLLFRGYNYSLKASKMMIRPYK